MKIQVKQINSPYDFLAIPHFGDQWGVSTEEQEMFLELLKEMNMTYGSSDESFIDSTTCSPGELYAVYCNEKSSWIRVHLNGFCDNVIGTLGSCYLIDFGEEKSFKVKMLKELREHFRSFPWQAKNFCLTGVQPLSSHFDADNIVVSIQPSERWDSSAVDYMRSLTKDPCEADVIHVDDNGVNHVTLFVDINGELRSLGEELISKKYAIECNFTLPSFVHKSVSTSSSPITENCTDFRKSHSKPPLLENEPQHTYTSGKRALKLIQKTFTNNRNHDDSYSVSKSLSPIESVKSNWSSEGNCHHQLHDGARLQSSQVRHSVNLSINKEPQNIVQSNPSYLFRTVERHESSELPALEADYVDDEAQNNFKITINEELHSEVNNDFVQRNPSHLFVAGTTPGNSDLPALEIDYVDYEVQNNNKISKNDELTSVVDNNRIQKSPSLSPEMVARHKNSDLPPLERDYVDGEVSDECQQIGSMMNNPKSITRDIASNKTTNLTECDSITRDGDFIENEIGNGAVNGESSNDVDKLQSQIVTESSFRDVIPGSQYAQIKELDRISSLHEKSISDRVYVSGIYPCPPIYDIQSYPFSKSIITVWSEQCYPKSVPPLQAHSVPSILFGRNVIGISPYGSKLAYLVPLLHRLSSTNKNMAEIQRKQKGNDTRANTLSDRPCSAPTVLILCHNSAAVEALYHLCLEWSPMKLGVVIKMVHSGTVDKEFLVKSPYDLLITTPPCCFHCLDEDLIFMSNLCHIVLDSADKLLNTFSIQIKDIMTYYANTIERRYNRLSKQLPRQLLVFSKLWTTNISYFVSAYVSNPLVIITSGVEAAIYGKVQHNVSLTTPRYHDSQFITIVNSLDLCSNLVVVFSSGQDQHVLQILKNCGFNAVLILPEKENRRHSSVSDDWQLSKANGRPAIFVCKDENTFDLELTSATIAIHYDFPDSKTKYGNRLLTMQSYFSGKDKVKGGLVPKSYVILSKASDDMVTSLCDILRRSNVSLPSALLEREKSAMHKKDIGFSELCKSMKAFGTCLQKKSRVQCNYRHILRAGSDKFDVADDLPYKGEIHFRVLHVESASCMYIRILRCRDLSTKYCPFKSTYCEVIDEMISNNSFYKEHPLKTLKIGTICCYIDSQKTCFRVQILKMNMNERGVCYKAVVKLIDWGSYMTCSVNRLYQLPERIQCIPAQAIETYLTNVKPVNEDTDWTSFATEYMRKTFTGKDLYGKIVFRLGRTLWLAPIVEYDQLKCDKSYIIKCNLRSTLIDKKLAIVNHDHLKEMFKMAEDVLESDTLWYYKRKSGPDVETLDAVGSCSLVYISAVVTPGLFYVQLERNQDSIDKLMLDIENYTSNMNPSHYIPYPYPGLLCVARFPQDLKFYRAVVTKVVTPNLSEVYFCDFGDTTSVENINIFELPCELNQLPLQAIECSLADISPIDIFWSELSSNTLWNLATYCWGWGDRRLLNLKVRGCNPSHSRNGPYSYSVELSCDPVDGRPLFAQTLVWMQQAMPTSSSFMELFSKPDESHTLSVKNFCQQFYWNKNPCEQRCLAQEVSPLVYHLSMIKLSETVQTAVYDIWLLILYHENKDVLIKEFMSPLVQIFSHDKRMLSFLLERNFVQHLCLLLLREDTESSLKEICSSIWTLSTDHAFQDSIEAESLECLMKFLMHNDFSNSDKQIILEAVNNFCRDSGRLMKDFITADILSLLISLLECSEESLTTVICSLLLTIAQSEYHSCLMKELLIDHLVRLVDCEKADIIQIVLQIFSIIISSNKYGVMTLLEANLYPKLKRLSDTGILTTDHTKDLCRDIMEALKFTPPKEQIFNQPIISNQESIFSNACLEPEVQWSQNTFYIILTIHIKGYDDKSLDIHIEDFSIKFRAEAEKQLYMFDMRLHRSVKPDDFQQRLFPSKIVISCRKREPGRWPCLLEDHYKPVYLSYDYTKLDSESSDSESDQGHFVPKTKKCREKFPDLKWTGSPEDEISSSSPEDKSDVDLQYD